MVLEKLTVGLLEENCYLVGDPEALLVIDPGAEAKRILNHIKTKGYKVQCVVLTHCHFDHVGAVAEVLEATCASLLIGANEKENYFDDNVSFCSRLGPSFKPSIPDRLLQDGEVITSGAHQFSVLFTPGHTSGSICLLCDEMLFSGDTLFFQSIGRADFPTGNLKALVNSVKEKLFTLYESVKVYAGHGPDSSIGYEKEHNEVYMWERFC